jgi:hypothetical protein
MSFQLTFLGYYPIKSHQLKKQTHSVKMRNWSHRERTVQADGPRWMAEADGFRRTVIADGLQQTGQPSASVGRPWRMAPTSAGRPLLPVVEGWSAPLFAGRGGRRMVDDLAVCLVDGRQGRRPWGRRMHPNVRWMRTWTSRRVTTLISTATWYSYFSY